jgi:DNA polymerase-3 subunit epsilon
MRQIVLDTETTGLDPAQGHRIIEIGCVELVNRKITRNTLHLYINPMHEVDPAALEVHGITNEFLADKPIFDQIAQDFINFVCGAELVIHNASFDIGFLNHELALLQGENFKPIEQYCTVLDTLAMARKKHPGQKNNLDALCKRYSVDNSQRDLHGALKDAEILAEVYLAMSGGQSSLGLGYSSAHSEHEGAEVDFKTGRTELRFHRTRSSLVVLQPTQEELEAHEKTLANIAKVSVRDVVWYKLNH